MWAAWGKGGPGPGGFGMGHMGCTGQASATQVLFFGQGSEVKVINGCITVSHPWILAKELLH